MIPDGPAVSLEPKPALPRNLPTGIAVRARGTGNCYRRTRLGLNRHIEENAHG
jgi:hypothetical protein